VLYNVVVTDDPAAEQAAAVTRPPLVTLLAVLQLLGAAGGLLGGVVILGAVAAGAQVEQAGVIGFVLLATGTVQLVCGTGLWKLRPHGRTMQLAFAWVGLIGFPFGTLISILILVYLLKPEMRLLFSGRMDDLSADERAHIAAVSRGPLATAVMAAVIGITALAVVALLAIVTFPQLLSERQSANEASAIGTLRAINSAQIAFAAACGNGFYAPTLAALAAPAPGQSKGFLAAEMAREPLVTSGYAVTLSPGDVADSPAACNGTEVVSAYAVEAVPLTAGDSGVRFFATNQEGVIFESTSPILMTLDGVPPDATPIDEDVQP